MAIRYVEVEYHHAGTVDFSNQSVNGIGLGVQIPNDQLNSVFPEVSATEREAGKVSRAKIIVVNSSLDRVMKDSYFFVSQDVFDPDRVKIYPATENTNIKATFDNDISVGTVGGTNIPVTVTSPSGTTVADIDGRRIIIGSDIYTVSGVSGDSIILAEDTQNEYLAGTEIKMDDIFDAPEIGELFNTTTAKVNTTLKLTFQSGVDTALIATDDADKFEVGDFIAIMDSYYRVIFRAQITAMATDGGDASRTILTMDKTYTGAIIIPTDEGYVANALQSTILPGDGFSFWVEMTIGAVQTVDSEVQNHFQLTAFFDDVAL